MCQIHDIIMRHVVESSLWINFDHLGFYNVHPRHDTGNFAFCPHRNVTTVAGRLYSAKQFEMSYYPGFACTLWRGCTTAVKPIC